VEEIIVYEVGFRFNGRYGEINRFTKRIEMEECAKKMAEIVSEDIEMSEDIEIVYHVKVFQLVSTSPYIAPRRGEE
jgi:hypothetical protein